MKRMFGLVLSIFTWLAACTAPQTATQAPFATVTEPPKTLVPTRLADFRLTPAPELVLVTTRAGQELQFRFIHMEANEYVAFHTESMADGIPLENGVEVAFKFIAEVDFDLPSAGWEAGTPFASWPVTITLTDGTRLSRSLGFKAQHQIHVTGDSNYGYVDLHLDDIEKIVIQRSVTPQPIPTAPHGENGLLIETLNGDMTRVTDPRIFTNCMYEVYCCHSEVLASLPLAQRSDIPLAALQTVDLSNPQALRLDLLSGETLTTGLRPSTSCPTTSWRLRGKAALGDFEIELSSIKKIEH